MAIIDELENKAAQYEYLKMTIKAHLKAYTDLLTDYERDLKQYLRDEVPQSLIDIQQTLISKAKAKISALEELNQ